MCVCVLLSFKEFTSTLLFNFQHYFYFLKIIHQVFTNDLRRWKVGITCILGICFLFVCFFLFFLFYFCLFFSINLSFTLIDITLLRRYDSTAKSNFLYFVLVGNAWYLVNVPFLIRTRAINITGHRHYYYYYYYYYYLVLIILEEWLSNCFTFFFFIKLIDNKLFKLNG